MSASTAVISVTSSVPHALEAKLCLSTLAGVGNPLVAGGKLVRTIPGVAAASQLVARGITTLDDTCILPTALPSPITYRLETPSGARLLELTLTLTDYTSDWAPDRMDVHVIAHGISRQTAQVLSLDPDAYSWRLSGRPCVARGVPRLVFDVIQEDEPTESVDALASTRLVFGAPASGAAQQGIIRVKRFKETIEPTS